MTSSQSAHILRAALAVALSFCVSLAAASAPALGAGATTGPITLDGYDPSMRSSDSIEMTAVLSPAAGQTRVRFKLLSPTERLIIQRTVGTRGASGGAATAPFAYDLEKLDLRPGIYTLEVSLPSSQAGNSPVARFPIYLHAEKPVVTPVVLLARVSGPPMRDPEGRFVVDPAVDTVALDDAVTVASAVLADPDVRLSLAISPLMLEEWRRIALGYELVGSAGVTKVDASSPGSRRYAQGLQQLKAALDTGRLELLAIGYTDPNPSSLARAGLLDDLNPQYRYGLSATFAAIAATPSAGGAFAGGCLPPDALPALASRDITYGVVGATCVRASTTSVTTGAYPVGTTGFTVLVADRGSTSKLSSGITTPLAGATFSRSLAGSTRPVIAVVELGPGRTGRDGLESALTLLKDAPWARTVTAAEGARNVAKRVVRLVPRSGSDKAPAGYWVDVTRARTSTKALLAAAGQRDADAQSANLDSLVAESSTWAGADGSWALADRGRSYSAAALRTAQKVLGRVKLTATPVTLSGTRGEIPVTIRNNTSKTLKVDLRVIPEDPSVRARGIRQLTLRPADNYVTVPVDLRSAVSARLALVVVSSGTRISSSTVTVRASYIDRLAIIGAIVLGLGGLLAFIVLRVRRAERDSGNDARVTAERYTDPGVRESGGAEEE